MGPRACADALHKREGMGDRPFPRPNHTLPSKNLTNPALYSTLSQYNREQDPLGNRNSPEPTRSYG